MRKVKYNEAAKISERPSRIVLAVSNDRENERPNIIALGWKMRTSMKPPMVAISVGKTRHSHELLRREKEFVLAFPGTDLAEKVLFCGTVSGREADKFKSCGLTPVQSSRISPPLIKECPVNYECGIAGSLDTGDHTIFAAEVLCSYISEKKRLLLSVAGEEGYRVILEKKGYRFGYAGGQAGGNS